MAAYWTQTASLSDLRSFTIMVYALTPSGKFYSKVFHRFISPSKLVAKQTIIYMMQKRGFTDIRIVGTWKDKQS